MSEYKCTSEYLLTSEIFSSFLNYLSKFYKDAVFVYYSDYEEYLLDFLRLRYDNTLIVVSSNLNNIILSKLYFNVFTCFLHIKLEEDVTLFQMKKVINKYFYFDKKIVLFVDKKNVLRRSLVAYI